MWHAATPVLAVAKVLFGGRDPMILLSKKDFPVPDEQTFKKELREEKVTQISKLFIDRARHHECVLKGDRLSLDIYTVILKMIIFTY